MHGSSSLQRNFEYDTVPESYHNTDYSTVEGSDNRPRFSRVFGFVTLVLLVSLAFLAGRHHASMSLSGDVNQKFDAIEYSGGDAYSPNALRETSASTPTRKPVTKKTRKPKNKRGKKPKKKRGKKPKKKKGKKSRTKKPKVSRANSIVNRPTIKPYSTPTNPPNPLPTPKPIFMVNTPMPVSQNNAQTSIPSPKPTPQPTTALPSPEPSPKPSVAPSSEPTSAAPTPIPSTSKPSPDPTELASCSQLSECFCGMVDVSCMCDDVEMCPNLNTVIMTTEYCKLLNGKGVCE
mmetsp:Transcript_15524/g.15654  ORF Transcript_15524/g.15654 Transcript_15524/m.15654 type:complete len:290 (-) Transcript_15524:158-1027(-)